MLGEGQCFRDQVLNACPGILKHSDETSLPQGTSLETLRHMVASGLGITILPSSSSDKHIYDSDTIVERPFAGKTPYRRVSLVSRKRFSRPKAIEALVQAITSCSLQGAANL